MTRHHKLTAVSLGTICALVGATAGIAESSAKVQHPAGSGWGRLVGPMVGGGPGFGGFGVIHAVSIRATTKGGFDTMTTDAGTITAAGANSLTIKEGSTKATYAKPTITPKGNVTVTLDGKSSKLSALSAGDRVLVVQSSTGVSRVIATDPSTKSTGPGYWGPRQSASSWHGNSPGGGWSGPTGGWGGPATGGW